MIGLFSDWKEKKVKPMLNSDSICRTVEENGSQQKKKEMGKRNTGFFCYLQVENPCETLVRQNGVNCKNKSLETHLANGCTK